MTRELGVSGLVFFEMCGVLVCSLDELQSSLYLLEPACSPLGHEGNLHVLPSLRQFETLKDHPNYQNKFHVIFSMK